MIARFPQNNTIMKKNFHIIIAAIAAIASMFNAATAAAQTWSTATFSEQGRTSLINYEGSVRAFESRQDGWQKANGEYAGVKLDQHWFGLNAGATYLDGAIRPIGGIAFGKDGSALWSKNVDGVKIPVRLFSYEVGAQLTQRQFREGAYSEGQKYLSYGVYALGKVQIVEDRWVRHRLNLVVGGMYQYAQDDELLSADQRVFFEGSAIFATAGLEYRFRPSSKSANALMLRAIVNYPPFVQRDITQYHLGGTVTLAYSFALNSRVK